jgi:hypothetical protein
MMLHPAVEPALVTRADLLAPDGRADPYLLYQRLREQDEVNWSRPDGWRTLTRYADVAAALRDPRFSSERTQTYFTRAYVSGLAAGEREQLRPYAEYRGSMMLYRDPPAHTRLRAIVQRRFTPRAIERLRPRIQQIVRDLLDPAMRRGRLDVVADLADPLPTAVVAELLGVGVEEHGQLRAWCDDLAAVTGASDTSRERFERARLAMPGSVAFLRGILDDHRQRPRNDLVGLLLAAEGRGEAGGDTEMVGYLALLLVAGLETTRNLIGNGVLALLRHPEQLQLLREQPELLPAAVEELLRYDGPVQMTGRVATEALELNGKQIRRGQLIECWLGAANRDPQRFPDPDRLDLRRSDNRHLAFGHGIHFCLGASLARLEAQVAIGELLQAAPNLELAGDRLEWQDGLMFHGLRSLPVRLG